MAQVVVTIDSKAYRMACEEGQEAHLEGLAQNFDRYVGHLKAQSGRSAISGLPSWPRSW